MGRLLAVGDVHGCLNTLKRLLQKVEVTPEDTLVFLGDYVDRGQYSAHTIDYLINLNKHFRCVFLLGNHELQFMTSTKETGGWSSVRTESMRDYIQFFGGRETLNSYVQFLDLMCEDVTEFKFSWLPQDHQEFFNNLRVSYEQDGYFFCHAGINPNVPLAEQLPHDLIWIRSLWLKDKKDNYEKVVVHGHTPMVMEELKNYNDSFDRKINVDGGCVFGYELVCCDVQKRLFHKLHNIDKKYES